MDWDHASFLVFPAVGLPGLAWSLPLPRLVARSCLPFWPALVPPPVWPALPPGVPWAGSALVCPACPVPGLCLRCPGRFGACPSGPLGALSRRLDMTLPYSLATISKLVIDGLAQARSATAAAEEASEDFTTAS